MVSVLERVDCIYLSEFPKVILAPQALYQIITVSTQHLSFISQGTPGAQGPSGPTGPIGQQVRTVEPAVSRHPWDQKMCPLKRGFCFMFIKIR